VLPEQSKNSNRGASGPTYEKDISEQLSTISVGVGVFVGVCVAVSEGVTVGVDVGVSVGVDVGVSVIVGVGVCVGEEKFATSISKKSEDVPEVVK
jgi:hypothetical protein